MKATVKTNRIEIAAQVVIMDAIEKGHTKVSELVEYMKSEVFEIAVKSYLEKLNTI